MGKTRKVDERRLVVVSGRTKGTAFVLTKPQVNAGRESDNAICLKGKRVSRYHVVLVRDNGEYTLRDVSPHIGTLLNGRRTKEAHLKVGDRIRIGEFEMSYEAATAPAIDVSSATAPAPLDEDPAPIIPVAAAQQEPVAELALENSTSEHHQRVAELTRETERLVGEVKLGNEALESVRVQLQAQSDLQANLTERLGAVSQENVALTERNGELQAKVSELKGAAGEADRLKAELTQEIRRLVGKVSQANEALEPVRAQLQTRSDQQAVLTERVEALSRENATLTKLNNKLQAKISELEASVAEALSATELDAKAESPEQALLNAVDTRSHRSKIMDLAAPIEPVAIESDEARMTAAKQQEEAVAKRHASDKTNEQFDFLRRTIVEKKNLRANMSLLDRFLLPFRDTARLVQEPEDTNPE